MTYAMLTIGLLFVIGGFVCWYEELHQDNELAYRQAVIEQQSGELAADKRLIEEMGQQCQ